VQPPDTERAERALEELVRKGFRAQSVKRALGRVVGERRAIKLLESLGVVDAAQGGQCDQQGQGSISGPDSVGSEIASDKRFMIKSKAAPEEKSSGSRQQRAERNRNTKGGRACQNRNAKSRALASQKSFDENVDPTPSQRAPKYGISDSALSSDSSAPKLPPPPPAKPAPVTAVLSLPQATAPLLSTPSPMPLRPVVLQAHGAADVPQQVDGQLAHCYVPGHMLRSTASVQPGVPGHGPYSPPGCIRLSI